MTHDVTHDVTHDAMSRSLSERREHLSRNLLFLDDGLHHAVRDAGP